MTKFQQLGEYNSLDIEENQEMGRGKKCPKLLWKKEKKKQGFRMVITDSRKCSPEREASEKRKNQRFKQ